MPHELKLKVQSVIALLPDGAAPVFYVEILDFGAQGVGAPGGVY